ncbi:MAG TPA: diacylglycerol kinase family protein [Pseudoneobacillus sp.]|nr:diacylglycerol kinase family protein [Pseudoneobacillus sp.]
MTKLYFIVNPKAGNGKAQSIWADVEKSLIKMNINYQSFFTEQTGHAIQLAKGIMEIPTEYTVDIIVVGGDGTLNEVVNGIGHKAFKARIGFIPGGSGNDFSRGFKIPKNPEDALQNLLMLIKKESPTFDVGQIKLSGNQEHFFINSTGAGFDALISYEANKSKWKKLLNRFYLGQFVYVIILLKNLFSYKCSTIELIIDGQKFIFPETWFVTISNQPFYGGGMKIAPDANPNDGKLNVTIVHQLSKFKLLFVFFSVFWGKHLKFKEVNSFLAHKVSIHSNEPIYVHSDGEHIGCTPIQVTVYHENISILTEANT